MRWALAIPAAAVLALAGCSSGPAAPTDIPGYQVVCAGNTPVPEAAAYTGRGPHPIAFFSYPQGSGNDGTIDGTETTEGEAPDSWYTTNVDQLQLVACISSTKISKTKDCGTYTQSQYAIPGSAATEVILQWYSFTISLYQAKTGTLVTKPITIIGNSGTTCPQNVTEFSGTTADVEPTSLSIAQVQQALDQYVS